MVEPPSHNNPSPRSVNVEIGDQNHNLVNKIKGSHHNVCNV